MESIILHKLVQTDQAMQNSQFFNWRTRPSRYKRTFALPLHSGGDDGSARRSSGRHVVLKVTAAMNDLTFTVLNLVDHL